MLHSPCQPGPSNTESLEIVVEALDRISSLLPEDHGLVAAVCDRSGQASDLLVRDPDGQTSIVIGLPAEQRRSVANLLAIARGEEAVEGPERSDEVSTPARAAPAGAHHRLLLDHSPVPLIVLDEDGRIDEASAGALALLRTGRHEEPFGARLVSLLHPGDHGRFIRRLEHAADGTLGTPFTARLVRHDGGHQRVELTIRRVAGAGGGATIVAIREAEPGSSDLAATLLAERQQRALANAIDAGIAILSMQDQAFGTILEANRGFGRIMGGRSEELIGHSILELVEAEDAEAVQAVLQAVAATGVQRRLDVRAAAVSGSRIELVIRPDLQSGEPPTQMTVRVRDVTEQRAVTAEAARRIGRLEESNRELAEFARVTAHDLAAPLRALSGLVDLLAPGLHDPESAETLAAIRSALGRMRGMVDSAVGYAQTQDAQVRRDPVDLEQILGFVRSALASEITRSGAAVTAGALPTVLGDAHLLERLFGSLIGNAIKYAGPRAPRVHVEAVRDGAMWRVAVSDEGVGVEAGTEERIFRLFERGPRVATGASGGGRGIGLATCRRIVELHGGRIWVEPNEPRGSVFAFTLPAAADLTGGLGGDVTSISAGRRRRPTIW